MDIDEFARQIQAISNAARELVDPLTVRSEYFGLPVPTLQRIYEAHRNINFRTPCNPTELVYMSFAFVDLTISDAMKRRYFEALSEAGSWPRVLVEFEEEANRLANGIRSEFEEAFRSGMVDEAVSRSDRVVDMSWFPERDLKAIGFIVDANCVNSKRNLPSMNQLEDWASDGLFLPLMTTEVAQREMATGNDARRRQKAYSFMFTMSEVTSTAERETLARIESILFPDGKVMQNQKNDAEIVFNAGKYHRMLVTMDGASKSQPGGILGNREKLAALGINVMTPDEAVELVQREIRCRDDSACRVAELLGVPVPDWVGKD